MLNAKNKFILFLVLQMTLPVSIGYSTEPALEKELKSLFAQGDKKLDASSSTEYTLRLFAALKSHPEAFLGEADRYYRHDFSKPIDKLVDETGEVTYEAIEKAFSNINKASSSFELAQRFLRRAKAKEEKIVNQNR